MTQIGYPHYTNLAVAVPLTGRPLVPYWTYAYANLHPPMNHNCLYMTNFDQRHVPMPGPVADLRNWYVEQAIANGCKYLMFIDEDVTGPPHGLRQLIFQMEHHPEAWAIGGVVCHKAKPTAPMIFRGNGNGPYWDWKLGEFFEVSGIGMGFTLLRVEPFKTLEKPWFKTVDNMEAFWDGIPKAEVWTEDLYWCDKAIKAGGKVYADTSILCDHWDMSTGLPTTLAPDSLPLRRATTKTRGQKKIVDLGCGESKYETDEGDVLTVDVRDEVNPDYRADLRKLPFANGEFDIVYCMAEGSPVLTRNGFKRIEDIVIGDQVWTHKDRWRPVLTNTRFDNQESLFRVTTAGNPLGIMVTGNHPILTYGFPRRSTGFGVEVYRKAAKGEKQFVNAEELSRHFVVTGNISDYVDCPESIDLAEYLPASEEVEDYALVMAEHSVGERWRRDGDKTLAVKYSRSPYQVRGWIYHGKIPFGYHLSEDEIYYHSATTDIRIPRYVAVDGDLMRLIGYYLSDGSLSNSGSTSHVAFHFNIDEMEYINDVQEIIADKFGLLPTDIRQPSGTKGLNLRYCSRVLYDIIAGLTGEEGALDKTIPSWALWAKPELQQELVEGLLRGDGTIGVKGKHSISTVSWRLAESIRFLLTRSGFFAGLSRFDYEIKPEGSEYRGCGWVYSVSWTPERVNQKGGMIADGWCVSRIWNVEKIAEDLPPVYGLSVADDESYFASGMTHHNSSHVLEHFPRSDTPKVLDEWTRILKPDGEMRLIVPNLEWAAEQIKLGAMNDDVLNVLYGAQTYGENFHQMGFTPAALTAMLKERGFKRIDVELVGYNLCTRAWRQPPEDLPSLGQPPAGAAATNGHGKTKAKKKSTKSRK